jgi:hypothetical protein
MKNVLKFAVAMLAAVVVGCGGGGTGPATKVTPPAIKPHVECIVKVLRTNLMHPNGWTDAEFAALQAQYPNLTFYQSGWTDAQLADPTNPAVYADLIDKTAFGIQDPLNIQCGEQMVFQVVNYSANGTRNILPGTSFQSSDGGTFGTLAGNTGDYIAGNSPTTSNLAMTGTINGFSYFTTYAIKIDQVRLIGKVLVEGTNALLTPDPTHNYPPQIQFFNQAGGLVDTVAIAEDGTFRASVPTLAASFTVVGDSLPSAYYQSFQYLGLQYNASQVTCYAPLPTGMQNGTVTIPGIVYIAPNDGSGLPTADGCSGPTWGGKKIQKIK